MKIFRDLRAPDSAQTPVALAIGIFDGVHLGHQAVIARAMRAAAALGGETWVLTLDPHPMKVLRPEQAPALLTSTAHKLRLIEECGVAGCIVLPFTLERAAREPEDFIGDLLLGAPAIRAMVVGENWTFGRGGSGTPALLKMLAAARDFPVVVVPPVLWKDAPISSTRIRNTIFEGELDEAARMLGRSFSVFGDVVEGKQFGRILGFPTANVDPHNEVHPPPGVYAACLVAGTRVYNGAAFRPEPGSESQDVIEIHLFDFHGNLYGQTAEVFFVKSVRPAQRFESIAGLRAQISRDVDAIREFFSGLPGDARDRMIRFAPPI